MDEFGDLAVRLIGCNDVLNSFGEECFYGDSDDSIVDNDASGEILPGFIFIAFFEEFQSFHPILLLHFFPLLNSISLLAHIPPIEDSNRFNLVVIEYL